MCWLLLLLLCSCSNDSCSTCSFGRQRIKEQDEAIFQTMNSCEHIDIDSQEVQNIPPMWREYPKVTAAEPKIEGFDKDTVWNNDLSCECEKD